MCKRRLAKGGEGGEPSRPQGAGPGAWLREGSCVWLDRCAEEQVLVSGSGPSASEEAQLWDPRVAAWVGEGGEGWWFQASCLWGRGGEGWGNLQEAWGPVWAARIMSEVGITITQVPTGGVM